MKRTQWAKARVCEFERTLLSNLQRQKESISSELLMSQVRALLGEPNKNVNSNRKYSKRNDNVNAVHKFLLKNLNIFDII